MKQKLREISSHYNFPHAPWIVNPDLVTKFNLNPALPIDLQDSVDKFLRNQRRAKTSATEAGSKRVEDDDDSIQGSSSDGENPEGEAPSAPGTGLLRKGALEDLQIDREGNAANAVPPPTAAEFPAPQNCIGQLLMIWNFCSAFSKAIGLTLFDFDDLAMSIGCNRRNPLLDEVHVAVMRSIFKVRVVGTIFLSLTGPFCTGTRALQYSQDLLECEDLA